ncbi:VTT domain-containing protein [Chelativorans sp.]|uniref:TVP38/TMEM64 family protein n=1 Tax=Chelativorans sp. TaxID=2203393 RepID=UPI002811D1E8|nr:VTT domain-containing protein [Chelativorans sp.]
MGRPRAAEDRKLRPWRFLPLGLLLLGLAAAYAMGWHEHLKLSALVERRAVLQAWIGAHPLLSAGGFTLLYAAAVAMAFPAASLLTIAAGFFFGWLVGGILAVVAAVLGSAALFLAARSAFGDILKRRIGGRAARLAQGFEEGAFGYLLVLRLAPIVPFWLVNIVPAFFNVPLRIFVTATALGILPGAFAYAYLGHGLESVLLAAAASGEDIELHDLVTAKLTLALAALAVLAAIAMVLKRKCAAKLP